MKIPLITLDKPNKNNRIYPRAVMEKAIAKYKEDFINKDRAVITSSSPDGGIVNMKDAVGLVKEIKTEGDTVFAEVTFLNIPNTLDIQKALQSGELSIRTAGFGNLTQQADGTFLVNEDYEILSCFLTNE